MKAELIEGDLKGHIKRLAIPAAIGLFFQAMYNVTDAYYVGQLSVTALAAVSISFPVYFLILSIGSGIGTAVNALCSKARGEGKPENAKGLAMQGIAFAVVLSIVASFLGIVTVGAIFDTIGAVGELHTLAVEYMKFIYLGLVFFFIVMVLNGILNSVF